MITLGRLAISLVLTLPAKSVLLDAILVPTGLMAWGDIWELIAPHHMKGEEINVK